MTAAASGVYALDVTERIQDPTAGHPGAEAGEPSSVQIENLATRDPGIKLRITAGILGDLSSRVDGAKHRGEKPPADLCSLFGTEDPEVIQRRLSDLRTQLYELSKSAEDVSGNDTAAEALVARVEDSRLAGS